MSALTVPLVSKAAEELLPIVPLVVEGVVTALVVERPVGPARIDGAPPLLLPRDVENGGLVNPEEVLSNRNLFHSNLIGFIFFDDSMRILGIQIIFFSSSFRKFWNLLFLRLTHIS